MSWALHDRSRGKYSMVNRVGKWIWADMLFEDWSITVTVERNPREVGFFLVEKRSRSASREQCSWASTRRDFGTDASDEKSRD